MEPANALPTPGHGKPNVWDLVFLLLLATCLLGAAYVGVLAYREGVKTEVSKRNGEAWLEWLASQSVDRAQSGYTVEACAARPGATWGVCEAWLLGEGGPMQPQRNAYSDGPIQITATCGGADRTVAGRIALERVTPLPPGAAVPFTVGPLVAGDSIEQKVTIRVSVCNKDASAIRVGEVDF